MFPMTTVRIKAENHCITRRVSLTIRVWTVAQLCMTPKSSIISVNTFHLWDLSRVVGLETALAPGIESVEQSWDKAEQAPFLSVLGLSKALPPWHLWPTPQEMVFPSSLHVHVGCHLIRGRFNIFILSFSGGSALHVRPQRAGLCLQGLFMCTAWYICVQCWAQGGPLGNASGAIWASINIQHEQSSCGLPDVCKVSSPLAVPDTGLIKPVIPRPLTYFILLKPEILP